jgi:hypothetical protein
MWTARTVSSAGILLLLASCSSTGDNPPGSTGLGDGGSNGTGAGPSSGATTSTGAQAGDASGATGAGDTGGGNGDNTGGNGQNAGGSGPTTGGAATTGGASSVTGGAAGSCADETAKTNPVPPILEFVIDITGSMGQDAYPTDPNNNATKLAELKRILPPAFAAFPTDWAVGIEFFNYNQGSGCYQGRQAVAIAPLGTNLNAINTAVAGAAAQNADLCRLALRAKPGQGLLRSGISEQFSKHRAHHRRRADGEQPGLHSRADAVGAAGDPAVRV